MDAYAGLLQCPLAIRRFAHPNDIGDIVPQEFLNQMMEWSVYLEVEGEIGIRWGIHDQESKISVFYQGGWIRETG